jgi:site-specific DNA recombinase
MKRKTLTVKAEPPDDVLTAVLYLRVSNAESARRNGEAEGYSLPVQRERCRSKASELGAVLKEEFIDPGKTGTTMNRAGLRDLLAYVNEHHPSYVVVYKLDRLARHLLDSLLIRRQLETAGSQLVSCSEHFDSTPAGELTLNFMGSVNQYYSSNLREEMKSKMIAKVRSGGTIGKAPPGYLNTISRVNGVEVRSVDLDEQRAPLMLWAFEEFSTGEWSLTAMYEALKDKGLTTVPSAKYAEKPIPRSTLARLLRNPYYTGIIVYKGVTYEGNHPQLVSQELFDKVQAVLDAHNVGGQKQRIHNHYLKGSVRCGECGSTLCITRAVNRHGSEYLYFFCLGNYRRYTTCQERAVPVELVESYIEDKWRAVQLSPSYADTITELLTTELGSFRKQQEREKARALKRRILLNEERKKLLNAHYLDAIPLELMKAEQDRITRELSESENQVRLAEVRLDQVETLIRRSMSFLKHCYETYVSAPPQLRRQLNQAMFEAFFVTQDGSVIAKPTEFFRSLLRIDALRVKNGRGNTRGPDPRDVHDSAEWQEGVPAWLAEAFRKSQGRNSSGRSTPVFSGMGLNEDYLAEGVGFEPTGTGAPRLFKSRAFVRSAIPPFPFRVSSHPNRHRREYRPEGWCPGGRSPAGPGARRSRAGYERRPTRPRRWR